ncbi:MAG: tetratricopeptide repeat protein [Methylophilus sp.]
MTTVKKGLFGLMLGCFLFSNIALAGMNEEIIQLQKYWEKLKYQTPAAQQEKGFEALLAQSKEVTAQYPDKAEPLIWQGIIEATFAGVRNGISGQLAALSLVKNAKKSFDESIKINPNAMHGSGYTSLGSLYYQVPSWPIAFGDHQKAKEYLTKGLELNPDGIDSNYFYGDFLYKTGDLAKAETVLKKALQASPREGREVSDEGRKKEINELLKKIAEKK